MKWSPTLFFFTDFAFLILLPLPSKLWNYRDLPPSLVHEGLRFKSTALCVQDKHSPHPKAFLFFFKGWLPSIIG